VPNPAGQEDPVPFEAPIRVAAVNDYELIVAGVAALLGRFPDRFTVVDALIVGQPIDEPVDIALFDTFGRVRLANEALGWVCAHENVAKVAVFSLSLSPESIEDGRALGVDGFISKALDGEGIADAIEAIARDEFVVAGPPDADSSRAVSDWPGRAEGLTQRESEVLVMMARGYTNAEIAAALYIGTETVKTHVRRVLTKLGLRNRAQAGTYVERSASFGPGNGRSTTPSR
jgi:DNA-binding NarL/FixJ family response regulator